MTTSCSKFILLGSRGMLGRAFLQSLQLSKKTVVCIDRPEYDLGLERELQRIPIAAGDIVINCVAWAAVDAAESHESEATRINGWMVGQLAQRCLASGAKLLHFSTDYVFSGESDCPYPIDGMWSPINAYGRSKTVGEKNLLACTGLAHLLIRTSWLYAPWGKNFVRTIAGLAQSRERLRVVSDQVGRPTSVEQLARISLNLLERSSQGVYHVTDGGQCTWHDFAKEIVRLTGSSCAIDGCTSEEYPTAARRPHYSVLDISRVESELGRLRSWQECLAEVIPRIN